MEHNTFTCFSVINTTGIYLWVRIHWLVFIKLSMKRRYLILWIPAIMYSTINVSYFLDLNQTLKTYWCLVGQSWLTRPHSRSATSFCRNQKKSSQKNIRNKNTKQQSVMLATNSCRTQFKTKCVTGNQRSKHRKSALYISSLLSCNHNDRSSCITFEQDSINRYRYTYVYRYRKILSNWTIDKFQANSWTIVR